MKTILIALVALATSVSAANKNPDPHPDITRWANEATSEQLQECPRIGPVMAKRIIAGRPFKDVYAVDDVKGIGPATMVEIGAWVALIAD